MDFRARVPMKRRASTTASMGRPRRGSAAGDTASRSFAAGRLAAVCLAIVAGPGWFSPLALGQEGAAQDHPLVMDLSKEGYNFSTELNAALDGRLYREAAQLIARSATVQGPGLLPDRRDPDLAVSLAVAIQLAVEEHPPLRQAIEQEYGLLGELRLKEAAAAGDRAAIEAVALKFFGTDAGADAYRWLGDRDLAAGRFALALAGYEQGVRASEGSRRQGLLARARLAGALVGCEVGLPAEAPVQIGSHRLSPGEFNRMVERLAAARRPAVSEADRRACLPPGKYEVRRWGVLDARRAERPGGVPGEGLDWAGRQIGAVAGGSRMYLNNQIEQVALDLETGRQEWVQHIPDDTGEGAWPLVRMVPAAAGTQVFTRRMAAGGPELVSMAAVDGQVRWSWKPEDGHAASDPLLVGSELFVLAASARVGEILAVELVEIDPASGEPRRRTPLAEFHDVWKRQMPCRVSVAGGRIVATLGGAVVCCDPSGRVHWCRRQAWARPRADDYAAVRQWQETVHEPPLVDGDRVFATQPGVRGVDCIDAATGRLVWHREIDHLRRPAGRTPEALVVQTAEGVLGLNPETGEDVWAHEAEEVLAVRPSADSGGVMLARRNRADPSDKKTDLLLVWLDGATGGPLEESVLVTLGEPDFLFGPTVTDGNRHWALFASTNKPARRDVVEIVPREEE